MNPKLEKVKTDFLGSFTPGKILAVIVIAILLVPLTVKWARKVPAVGKALDAVK